MQDKDWTWHQDQVSTAVTDGGDEELAADGGEDVATDGGEVTDDENS
jgi:hypothetical protein